ncbi:MAG: hypothetical protein WC560_11225, partial [Syntrophales bacterium]
MASTPIKKLSLGVLAGLIGSALALTMWFSGRLDTWEAKTWDWRVNIMARPGPATEKIRVILLDQNSLDWARKENGLT